MIADHTPPHSMSPESAPPEDAAVSRRAALRGFMSAASALALGGCAGLAATTPRFDASEISTRPTVLVATTRKAVNGGRSSPWFGTERGRAITVARATMTPPDES